MTTHWLVRRTRTALTCTAFISATVLLGACGDGGSGDDAASSTDAPAEPITPNYGANAFAYEGMGFDALLAQGLTGAGVDVCVVDTGIDASHPAFAKAVEAGRLRWADFSADASPNPVDTNGHGTHVAGIIAMHDTLTGGAPLVRLLVARVFSEDGGADNAVIAEAVDWCREEGADVISMSLGGLTLPAIASLLGQDATASEAAVGRAVDQGIVVVAAAGNTEATRDVATPANVAGVVAVGALNQDLVTKATFSQSGLNEGVFIETREDPNRKPETAAPGVQITSAMAPDSALSVEVADCNGEAYCALDGTSQATPFVTAVIALILEALPELRHDGSRSEDPRETLRHIKEALAASAQVLPGQTTPHDDGVGYGLAQGPALLDRLGG